MNDWYPALTTTSLLVIALWFGRKLIEIRLTKSVQHEFDTKLESLRAKLKENEELFKAELRTKEVEIASLRSGAMTAMASRQIALDKRRLEAVDQLWSAFTALWPAKGLTLMIAPFDFDKVVEESARDPKLREAFAMLENLNDPKKIGSINAIRERPFVSPMAWAIFSAYQSIVMQGVAKCALIKSGIGKNFLDKDAIAKLVKAALPHYEEYINKYGDSAYHYLLDELEEKLLDELQKILAGAELDKASVAQAAEILKLSNEIMASSKQSDIPPYSSP